MGLHARALDLPSVPKTLLVVGGGYIGLELGSVYATLGSAVTIVEMTSGLLPGADRDLVDILAKRLAKVAKRTLLNTKVVSMTEVSDGIRVVLDGGGGAAPSEETFDSVLVSIGRRPNSEIPGLERTAVQVDRRGFIVVNAQRRTDEPSIFAIGDVAGEPMLAHKASHEGRIAVEAIVGDNVAFEPRAIPAVVYTDPEIAWCGLTETQAASENRPVTVAKFPWAASGRAISIDRTDGLTKLVLDEGERPRARGRNRRIRRGRADCGRCPGHRDGCERHRHEAGDSSSPHPDRNRHGVGRDFLWPGDPRLQTPEGKSKNAEVISLRLAGVPFKRPLA